MAHELTLILTGGRPAVALGELRTDFFGWSRTATVDGRLFSVSVRRGRAKRGMYGRKGFEWNGAVYDASGEVWHGRVTKSTGVRGLLVAAGVLPPPARRRRPWEVKAARADET